MLSHSHRDTTNDGKCATRSAMNDVKLLHPHNIDCPVTAHRHTIRNMTAKVTAAFE
jgi:hypothetical protein